MAVGTVIALTDLETAEAAISATRPTQDTDGVDITPWHDRALAGKVGAAITAVACFMCGDGTNRTLSSPTGGSKGPEIHGQVLRKGGGKLWTLFGTFDDGIQVPGAGAAGREANFIAYALRLAIAATPDGGAPVYFFQPLAVGTEE